MGKRRKKISLGHHRPFEPEEIEEIELEAPVRRPGPRASFTPTPAQYVTSGRKFHRRGYAPPFPQEQPEGLQDYGAGDDVHTRDGEEALERANMLATRSANLADEGDCNTARRFLNSAHGSVGAAVAHSRSGGHIGGITSVTSTLDRAEKHYAARCPVKKKR